MVAAKNRNRLPGRNPARKAVEDRPAAAPFSGFTLIEVLLALAIFSIGLLAVAGMQVSSVTRNTSSRMNTMAVEYASDYMERLLGLGIGAGHPDESIYDFPQLAEGGPYRPDDPAMQVDDDGDPLPEMLPNQEFAEVFDLSWTVTDGASGIAAWEGNPPGLADGVLKQITVTVTWANGRKSVSLTSIKAMGL